MQHWRCNFTACTTCVRVRMNVYLLHVVLNVSVWACMA